MTESQPLRLDRPVGIDLGTTNSAIAMMAPQSHDIWLYKDRFQRATYPSVVGWNPDADAFVTGWEAWNRRMLTPLPVTSIKRKMGKRTVLEIGPAQLFPEEIASKILAGLLAPMEEFCAERAPSYVHGVSRAVITVPAYFDAPQIDATRRAGELAGVEVVSLVQEPTAAAMYHAWKHGIGDGNFLVYDLGGGTFDVSIIRALHGEYQVLGIGGDNYLGGDDFDRRLAERFRAHLQDQGYALDLDVDDDDDRTRFLLLVRAAQEAKEALSSAEFHYVGRRDIFKDQEGRPVTLELELGRNEFEELIRDFVEASLVSCHDALGDSAEHGVELEAIDHVLLVGGSTRIPLVERLVGEAFCGEVSRAAAPLRDEPDTCVALGAAIHAANLGGLTLWDDEERSISIATPLYTHSDELRIVGRFAGPSSSLDGAESVALFDAAGEVVAVARAEHDEGGALFEFDEVRLAQPGSWPFDAELCDADGEPLASFRIEAIRGTAEDGYKPTGSALSNPTVLAKDIYLEVVRDGVSERQVLLRRGVGLPTGGEFRFHTADRSGVVILRLFQNRFPIRTIHLTLPRETPVGTPVDLDVRVDETMTIVAQGELVGQKFWAQIEPPPEAELREWASIEELLDRVDVVTRELWGWEAEHFADRARSLVAGIRETARSDPDKLQALAARLEDLLDDYHATDAELTPAWGRFVSLLDAVKRVVYRADGSRQLGLGTEEWRAKLERLEAGGRDVYDANDQAGWTRAFNQAQALWESIAQEEYRFRHDDIEEQLQRLQMALALRLGELQADLDSFALSDVAETRALQRTELDRIRAELDEKVTRPLSAFEAAGTPAAHAKAELDRLFEVVRHIRKRFEKLPTLGLVSR